MTEREDALYLKQLDHVQTIVSRLAGNSFLLKGWAVTIVSGFAALVVKDAREMPHFVAIAAVPALIFWFLDGYYLANERAFRRVYSDGLANGKISLQAKTSQKDILLAALTWTTSSVYVALIVVVFSLWIALSGAGR